MALTEDRIKTLPKMSNQTQAIAGKDTLLFVAVTKDPTEWLLVGGQRNTPLTRKADSIDATSKDSGEYSEKIPGMLSWSMSYEGLYILNSDAYAVFDDRFSKRKLAYIRIEYPDGSFRTGWTSITQLEEDHNYNAVSTAKITLEGKGAISNVQSVGTPTVSTDTVTMKKGAAADTNITITPATAFPRSIKSSDGDTLHQNTDFTYVEGKLTIKKEYLSGKTTDFSLTVKLTADIESTVKVTVTTA